MSLSSNIRAGLAYVEVTAETSKLQRNLTSAQAQLQNFGRTCTTIGKDMVMLSGALSVPLIMAAKSFAGFDDRMRLVQAVTQATEADFKALTKTAQRLGRDTSYTAQQAADAMVSLGRMGFSPKEIQSSIDAVLNLARSTGTELADAGDIAANSMRIFGIEASKMADVSDVLTVTANSSAQTLVDLFEALKMGGPQAAAAGESIRETSASIAVLANMGIKGSLAGTALRKSFSQFAKVKVQDQLKAVGVETVDSNGNLRKMAEIMRDIAKVMNAMPTAEKLAFAEDIFDIRGSLAGLTLGANVDELDAMLAKLQDVEGVAAKTATAMDAGLGGAFRLLESAAEGALNATADAMNSTLQPMIKKITDVINATTVWIEKNQKLVTALAVGIAGTAAFGVGLVAIGVAAKGLAAGISVAHGAITGFNFIQGVCIAQGSAIKNTLSTMVQAFANYRNTAIPAMVATEQLCSVFGVAGTTANRTAASIILMSNAEAAVAAKSALAAKWRAMTTALKAFWQTAVVATVATKAQTAAEVASGAKTALAAHWTAMSGALRNFSITALAATVATKAQAAAELALSGKSAIIAGWRAMTTAIRSMTFATISATAATYAHAVAEKVCTAGTVALNKARQVAIALTAVFTSVNLKAAIAVSAVAAGNFLLAAAAKIAAVAMLALSAVMNIVAAHPVAAALVALGLVLAGVCYTLYRAGNYTAKLSENMGKLREKGDELRKTDQLRMERLQQLAQKQKLTNAEMAEASSLASKLQKKYGDLGITISGNAMRITQLDSAVSRLGDLELKISNMDELQKLQRLKALSLKVNLSIDEQIEAEKLISDLSAKYGNLGVAVDKASGKIIALNAQIVRIQAIEPEVKESGDLKKLQRLKDLSLKVHLEAPEQSEAEQIISDLSKKYGDLGLAVDKAGRKIINLNSVAASLREISIKVSGTEDAEKVARLQSLARIPAMNDLGVSEANELIAQLTVKYGSLGISVDEVNGRIVALTDAQKTFSNVSMVIKKINDPNKETHLAMLARLQKLAEQENLTASEQAEAQNIVNALNGAYNGLGLNIDSITGKLNMATDAQKKLNNAMREATIAELDAEISEMEANISELQKENEALQSFWNHNLMAQVTGRQQKSLDKLENNSERMAAYRKKVNALQKRKQAVQKGADSSLTGDESEKPETTQENVNSEKQRQAQVATDADNAAKRAAEIEKRLRREGQTELQNEIDDIIELGDEYKQLIQTMLDYEKSKPELQQNQQKIAELEDKLGQADKTAEDRIAKAKAKSAETTQREVSNLQRNFTETEQGIQRRRAEEKQDRTVDNTLKNDKSAGLQMLRTLITKYQTEAAAAKAQFQKELQAAQSDGQIDDTERLKLNSAQEAFSRAESLVDKYSAKLRSASDGTEEAVAKTDKQLASSWSLESLKEKIGGGSAADRTATATEQTVALLEKTNKKLDRNNQNTLSYG